MRYDLKTQERCGIYESAHVQVKLYDRAARACGDEPADLLKVVVVAADGEYREMDCAADDETVAPRSDGGGAPARSRPCANRTTAPRRRPGHEAAARTVADLYARLDRTGDCWLWKGARTEKGYGQTRFRVAKRRRTGRLPAPGRPDPGRHVPSVTAARTRRAEPGGLVPRDAGREERRMAAKGGPRSASGTGTEAHRVERSRRQARLAAGDTGTTSRVTWASRAG